MTHRGLTHATLSRPFCFAAILAMGSLTAFTQTPAGFPAPPSSSQIPVAFPTTLVGASSTSVGISVTITGNATAAAPQAVTQGVSGADFSVAGGGSCAPGTAYSSGQICTVNVVFQPKAPGLRPGAVVLVGADGSLLGETLVGGIGKGSLAVLVPGRIDTVVGSGQWVYRADGVPATDAPIFLPMGVAVDAAGNLYLSDSSNNRIRRVDAASGLISTVAGNGIPGFSGDNGPAKSANISAPSGIVLDGAGNIFFADTGNSAVRRVDAVTGIITTIAGTGGVEGFAGDGGPAAAAKLGLPQGLAFDTLGNLYIADTGNNAIRMVDATMNSIRTVAGSVTGTSGYSGDGGAATSALFNGPWGITIGADNTIYIADLNNDVVRRVDAAGIITTYAGTGTKGNSGDGSSAVTAQLNQPAAVALDPAGNLYVADAGNNRVRKVNSRTRNIETVVGTGSEAFTGDMGPANLATLYGPYALYFDSTGNLYIGDMFHNRVRKVSASSIALKFDPVRVSKLSPAQLENVENDGNASLTFAAPAFSNAALEAATTTCHTGSVIGTNVQCTLGVVFAPSVTGDPVTGFVNQGSDASNSPTVITLSGTVLSVEPTSVKLISSQNPSLINTAITFTATVTSADTSRGGPVVFLDGTTQICSIALSAAGIATCTTSALTLGQHSITANYAGDANNASSVSAALLQVVKQKSSLALAVSPNPAVVTTNITLSATATGAVGTPSGTVTFYDGPNAIGTGTLDTNGVATFSTTSLAPGTHALSAQYGGDAGNASTTSASVSEVVSQATTTTTLASSNSTIPVGTSVTFSATVTVANGSTPTGTITFLDGATTLGTVNVNSAGTASLTLSTLAPGSHIVVASYSGDANDALSSSAGLTENIQQIATSTLLSIDVNPANAGATIHLTATVQMDPAATPAGALSGQVTFIDGSVNLGTAPLNASGVAILSLGTLSVGQHNIVATYNGVTNYAGSASSTIVEQIRQTATSTVLSSSSTKSLAGKTVTFTATITSATGTPTGLVTFMDGNVVIGTATVNAQGIATLTISSLSVGNHAITAVYGGDSSYTAGTSTAVSEVVSLGTPTLTLAGPGAPVNAGTAAALTVTVTTNGATPSGTLTLSDGGTIVATQSVAASGNFTFSIFTLAVGSHTLTAAFAGDANNSAATSNSIALTVQLAATASSLQSDVNPQTVGLPVHLTAQVTSTSPGITGTVSFQDGATVLGTVSITGATASLTISSLGFGTHTLTATYVGDANHASSTSTSVVEAIVQTVNAAVTSSANPAIAGTNVIFSSTVSGSNGLTPTGQATFMDGSVALGAVALDSTGTATFATNSLAVGTHPITVTYAGDKNYAPSVSATLLETVQNASSQVILTGSANPATYGTAATFTAVVRTNGGIASGTVNFADGTSLIGSAVLNASGTAVLTTSTLAPGPHAIVATYVGDTKSGAAVSTPLSISVLQVTTLALNSSANPSPTLNAITLTVAITNSGVTVPTGSVTFTDSTVKLGTSAVDASGHATLLVPSLPAGTHTLQVSYTGDSTNFSGVSANLAEVVQLRPTTNTLTATATSTTNSQQVLLISVVRWTGTTVPTGLVTFTSGGAAIGTAPVDSTGVATLTIFVQSTSQSIVAGYAGDASYAASASTPTSITGGPATQFTMQMNPTSMSVQSKQHGTVTLTINSIKGFTDTLEFGCLGLPYAATCTFDKTQMTLQPNGTVNVNMVLDTGNPLGAGGTASLRTTNQSGILACALPGCLLAGMALWRKRRTRLSNLLMFVFALVATLSAAGCNGLSINGTPAGKYTFQVTAQGMGTAASQSQTMTLTVTE